MKEDSGYSFDLSYLNQVFQGNQVMINQIISMFVKQVPSYIEEMENCVMRMDLGGLHPLAHKAKSSIAMLGLKDMEELILNIEHKSKNGLDFNELPDLVNQVSKECQSIKVELESLLNQ